MSRTTTPPGDPGTANLRAPSAFSATEVAIIGTCAAAALVAITAVARFTAEPGSLSALAASVLGVVEGMTEYLPVSSTGHLLVAERILRLGGTTQSDDALDTYAICIQAGAIAAVAVLYRARLVQMLAGLVGRDAVGRHLLQTLLAAFVPTAALALVFENAIRSRLFGPGPVAAAWVVGGVGILLLTRAGRLHHDGIGLDEIGVRTAALVGVAQALSLWPGVSRSLVTIVAAVLLGVSLPAAVEFSFLLGLATLGAATGYEALKSGSDLVATFGWVTPGIGLVVAFLSALAAVRWMIAWLAERGLAIFGWYRIGAGVLVAIALALGALG